LSYEAGLTHLPARRGLNVEALFCGRQFPLGALGGQIKGLRYPAIFSQTGHSAEVRGWCQWGRHRRQPSAASCPATLLMC